MLLNYKIIGEGKPLFILHGLFGSLDNWQTHGKKLAEYFQVILVDQRNHGHSDWNQEHNYDLLSQDLLELFQKLEIKKAHLLGHSMGGKTVMQFAKNHSNFIDKLIVVDIALKRYPMHHGSILDGIHAVSSGEMNSRLEAEKSLSIFIDSPGVRQFLSKNLFWKEPNKLAWRMNVNVLENQMDSILQEIEIAEEIWTPTLFIRGALSDYVLDEDISELENNFPDSNLITIPNAGHWVHAEAPEEFMNETLNFLIR